MDDKRTDTSVVVYRILIAAILTWKRLDEGTNRWNHIAPIGSAGEDAIVVPIDSEDFRSLFGSLAVAVSASDPQRVTSLSDNFLSPRLGAGVVSSLFSFLLDIASHFHRRHANEGLTQRWREAKRNLSRLRTKSATLIRLKGLAGVGEDEDEGEGEAGVAAMKV